MSGRRLAATLAAAAALCALAAAPAHAESPWWQLLTGSRPTNLQPAPDQSEVQEVRTAKFESEILGEAVAVPVELGGETVGCLGAGGLFGSPSAAQACEEQTGFAATETPAALAELLEGEGLYDGEVALAGPEGMGEAPAGLGEGPFTLITPGRWVTRPLEFGAPLVVYNSLTERNTPSAAPPPKSSAKARAAWW